MLFRMPSFPQYMMFTRWVYTFLKVDCGQSVKSFNIMKNLEALKPFIVWFEDKPLKKAMSLVKKKVSACNICVSIELPPSF